MKKLNKLFAILVAMAMVLSLTVISAFAAITDPDADPPTTPTIAVTKNLQVAADLSIDDVKGGVTVTIHPTGAIGSATDTVPTNDWTYTYNFEQDTHYANEELTDAATNGYSYTTGEITPAMLGLSTDNTETKPGIYTFTVKESNYNPSVQGVTLKTTDETSKTFDLRVKKSADGTFQFVVAIGNNKYEVKNGSTPGDITGNKLQFTNTLFDLREGDSYRNAAFKMKKTVDDTAGIYNNEAFNFDYYITIPAGATAADVVAVKLDKDGQQVGEEFTPVNLDGTKNSISLAKDESVYFKKIPAGSKVAADENDPLASKNATDKKAYVASNTGVALTTLPTTGDPLAAEIENKSNEDNTFEGVLHNSIPYIVLALVAIGGMVAYVVVRRRNADEA